jgi:hypothetical protein
MHVLPEYAFALDQLSHSDLLEGISEECAEWFWRFSICVGMPKKSSSEEVLNFTKEALKALVSPTDQLRARLKQIFPMNDPAKIIESWMESLLIMHSIASNRDECQWVAPLYPSDNAFTKNPTDFLDSMSKNIEKAIKKLNKE